MLVVHTQKPWSVEPAQTFCSCNEDPGRRRGKGGGLPAARRGTHTGQVYVNCLTSDGGTATSPWAAGRTIVVRRARARRHTKGHPETLGNCPGLKHDGSDLLHVVVRVADNEWESVDVLSTDLEDAAGVAAAPPAAAGAPRI